jgi:hypothetical protein
VTDDAQSIYQSEHVAVIDDFLTKSDIQDLFNYVNAAEYQSVHAQGIRKAWRLGDGCPLQGSTVCFQVHGARCRQGEAVYPTGTVIDRFIVRMLQMVPSHEGLVGRKGVDWEDLTFAPWVYPKGTGLSLHYDGIHYRGAYTFFVHPQWNAHWGGQLIVADPRSKAQDAAESSATLLPWLNDTEENERFWMHGLGLCIFAKPNRLVLLGPDTQHMVTRVDPDAGQHARLSIAGFFRRPVLSSERKPVNRRPPPSGGDWNVPKPSSVWRRSWRGLQRLR